MYAVKSGDDVMYVHCDVCDADAGSTHIRLARGRIPIVLIAILNRRRVSIDIYVKGT